MNRRQLTLSGALATTLVATSWVAMRPEDATVPVVAAVPPARRAVAAASAPEAPSSGRAPWAEASPEQLAAWQPPPPPPLPPAPPPVAAASPPPPMAPPLSYQMIGRVFEGAAEVALLSDPNNVLSVKRGDVIDGQWRVEQVTPSGVSLTWLPGKLPQTLVFKAVP
jgi:hypothetical protein